MAKALVSARTKRQARWVGRFVAFVAEQAWKYRVGLAPLWLGISVQIVGAVCALTGVEWPIPMLGGLLGGVVLWFGGEQMSPRVQAAWMWLVPSALDDGRKGILDRPTERGFLAVVVASAGAWLGARVHLGLTDVLVGCWGLGVLALGGPWWWHRGFRRRKPINRWVKRWKRLEKVDALRAWHGSRVIEATGGSTSTALRVRLRAGLTVKHVGGEALEVCSALGLRPGAVTVARHPGAARDIMVRIVPRDPWGGALFHPLPAFWSLLLAQNPRPVVGMYEDGTEDRLKFGQHMLIVGQTGSGKSVWLESLLAWLLSFRDVRVVAADLASGATLGIWEGVFVAPLATDVNSAVLLIQRVFAVIEYREALLSRMKRDGSLDDVLPPSPDMPWLFFVIDEFPDLVKAAKARKSTQGDDPMILTLERLANKGRKVGVWLILGAQNPTANDVGSTELRGALTAVIGLGLSARQSQNLWGSDKAEGWDSTPLTIGTYLCRDRDAAHQSPRVAKGLYVPPAERLRLIREASTRPRALDRGSQDLLDGGDRAPAIGDTARSGVYEEVPPSGRRHLTVVGGGGSPSGHPAPVGVNRPGVIPGVRVGADDLDTRVLDELPPAHQGGVGASGIAAQLGVDRGKVERALRRLEADGAAQHTGKRGGWART